MRVEKTQENISLCLCLRCPSYSPVCRIKNALQNKNQQTPDLAVRTHYEKMFCAFQKSNCIHIDRGCLCAQCAVFQKYALNREEFCLHAGGKQTEERLYQ